MKTYLILIPLAGLALSSCRMINDSMVALEYNRQQIDDNTQAIYQNTQAVAEANRQIEENRRQLDGVNNTLRKVIESEKS